MDPIRFAINRPVAISVAAIVVIMFGLIGFGAIPIQLTPTIDRPIITVSTSWPGRGPEEIVDSIAREQEKRLKNVTNLRTMRTMCQEGQSTITLEFYLGANVARAVQEVSDALRQVPAYPEQVDEPTIKTAEGSAESAIAWIIIDLDPAKAKDHPGFDISTLYDAADRELKPYLERIDGVAEVNIYGGRERQVRVLTDPRALAERGLSHADVVTALRGENRNESAGSIAEGKRDVRVRLVGQYQNEQDVLDTVIAYRDGRPVYVRDVAEVEIGHDKVRGFVRSMGVPCLAVNVIRQGGSNVMSIMDDVRTRINDIRTDILPRLDAQAGKDLRIRQVYDETVYIHNALDLVTENLWIGGALSVAVLLVFLRSVRSTLIIALAIPISIIGTFLVMLAAGRTLNVISLAGLAFSTGVVVDNAIVVLENIDRRRAMGDPPMLAVYRGAREVWTAILSGTMTHVAVFVPILTVKEEVGQLFFDLSLAMAVSVLLSLTVAISVVPAAAGVFARLGGGGREQAGRMQRMLGIPALVDRGVVAFSRLIEWLITGWRGWTVRPALIVVMAAGSIWGSKLLMPPMDYLPPGNQNLVFGGMLVPPGLSVAQFNEYADGVDARVGPYLATNLKNPEDVKKLPKITPIWGGITHEPVIIENHFVGSFQGGLFAGAISADPQRVIPVGALLTNAMNGMPDAYGGASQASIFGSGIGGGNTIDVEISGVDLEKVSKAAEMCFGIAMGKYGPGNAQPKPANFNKLQTEWQLRLTAQGRQLGVRTQDLAVPVRGLVDGAFAGEFRLGDRNADILVLPSGGRLDMKEKMADIPVMTPGGRIVPLSVVAEAVPGRAPQEIQRIEELPAVTIQIRPPEGKPLQVVMDEIRSEVIAPAEKAGLIDPTMRVRLEGTAAKLDQVKASLLGQAATGPESRWQKWMRLGSYALMGVGVAAGLAAFARGARRGARGRGYAMVGIALLGLVIAGVFLGIAWQPQLLVARFVWAVLVTYFIMCALFESFLSPFVIMFSVPPAVVGGFAALRLVHEWTLTNPNISPQQLDTLTMIGFVILVGTVVNNAILIVEQSLNFMDPKRFDGVEEPLPPMRAIAESVRTRVRPIFMTTFTTVFGGLPLVIAPGAGSEIYRGLGAVTVGGLLVSTLFTLVLVPLAFSLVQDMTAGVRAVFGGAETPGVHRALEAEEALAAPTNGRPH